MASPSRLLKKLRKRIALALAQRHRRRASGTTFIGITGTSGKTTTVALTAAILREVGPCQQTESANAIGDVIRVVRATGSQHRFCVAEIAASGPGSLDDRVALFRPDIAVLTVVGREHLSAYPDVGSIATEKAKLVLGLGPPDDGIAVLNLDDPPVRAIAARTPRRVLGFGRDPAAALRLVAVESAFPAPLRLVIEYAGQQHVVATRMHGEHMAVPVLAALGAALAAGVPLTTALPAIARFEPIRGRMQVVRTPDDITWIRDDWKAPAWSFATPFALLAGASAPRRVAIIGTVSDTTGDSGRNYRRFGQTARAAADLVVFVGPLAHRGLRARAHDDDSSIQAFPTVRAAADWLRGELRSGDVVLLKGSHKADHLARILFDRQAPVTCWRERCPIIHCCSVCPDLRAPAAESSVDSSGTVSTVSQLD